ncbi:MAG: fused MFS/spermidine synthase, partial [Candidatus Omnitrophica bacterium]|nr:fused MFS/spermidine synthase [Candidatus Omnitrophota bacterium]
RKLYLSAFVLGLTSMVGQIIIIRELIVVSYGNELSLGIILASWLFWVSIGSLVFGRVVDKIKFKETLLSIIQLAASIALPLHIFLIRNIKSLLHISPGEIMGFPSIFISSFLSLSAICTLLGFTFTLISKLAAENSDVPSKEIGKIYLLEGLGASIGGIVYSFFLIKTLSPLQNTLIIGSCNLVTSIFFNRNILQLAYLIIISVAFTLNWPSHLDRFARSMQFRPFKMVKSIDSIYGNISVTKTGKEYSFFENGLLMFTSGDALTSEEAVHYAMLEHPSPKNVLLIGGGVGGPLQQILKHRVDNIDYVELDPLIIEVAEEYLPPLEDKRVNIHHIDGRLFVKEKLRDPEPLATLGYGAGKRYDVIIINLPDPYTAMLNRFYSVEFFGEVKEILSDGGLLSFSLTSSENYINRENARYLGCIYNTLQKEFKDIKVFPGNSIVFLASNKVGSLTYDANILLQRLKERRIKTQFVREYYLPFKLAPLRIKYVENTLQEFGSKKINQDLRPIGYFYHMLLWMTLFSAGRGILPHIGLINIYLFGGIAFALFLIALLTQKLKRPSFKMPVALSVAATGISEIAFQIIVILAFQFLYGYVYYKIGIILTSFMIGLVFGSFYINKRLGRIKDERSLYIKIQAFICVYPLILPLIFTKPIPEISFAILPIIAGFLGGVQFPLANKICLENATDVGKTTGGLYGIDLLGACIGGLLVSLLLVPILGIIQTCIFLFIINTLVLILLYNSHQS